MPRAVAAAGALALVAAVTAALPAVADPDSGSITPSQHEVSWQGSGFPVSRPVAGDLGCLGPGDPTCDHFALSLDAPEGRGDTLVVEVQPAIATDDLDIHVFDDAGNRIGGANSYDAEQSGRERAVLVDVPDGDYTLTVQPYLANGGGAFTATARLSGPDEATAFASLRGQLRESAVLADCVEAVPHPFADVLERGTGTVILDTLVLVDELTVEDARSVVQQAAASYAELGLDLAPTFDTTFVASTTGEGNENGGPPRPQADADQVLAEARDHVGGLRPEGIDAVVVVTSKDLLSVSGRADCIGGVHSRETGFAVAEGWHDGLSTLVGSQTRFSSVVFAHELGHVFGAHHHYATCAYGAGANRVGSQAEVCTVMMSATVAGNRVHDTSLWFSRANATVVRSHALDYAQPHPGTSFGVPDPLRSNG